MLYHLLTLALCCVIVRSAHLPSDFKTCRRSDPKFNDCLLPNVKDAISKLIKGNKQLGLVPFDPLAIKEMSALAEGRYQLLQKYTNLKIEGLAKSNIKSFRVDFENKKIKMETYSPILYLTADYELKGKASLFNIDARGRSNQTLEKFKINHEMVFAVNEKEGKEYMTVTDYTVDFADYLVHLYFSDLMPTNKQLEVELEKLLAENANPIFAETKKPYEKNFADIFKHLANLVFSKVPMDEIFPN